MAKDRVTVQEAASRLGVKEDAVRKRIQRGSIQYDKDSDGRVYVYLDAAQDASYDSTDADYASNGRSADTSQDAPQDAYKDALVEAKDETIVELRDQVDFLRRELERKDTIIMSLTQRIPELEAPTEPSGGTQTASEGADKGDPKEPEERAQRRSWWRQFFGME